VEKGDKERRKEGGLSLRYAGAWRGGEKGSTLKNRSKDNSMPNIREQAWREGRERLLRNKTLCKRTCLDSGKAVELKLLFKLKRGFTGELNMNGVCSPDEITG